MKINISNGLLILLLIFVVGCKGKEDALNPNQNNTKLSGNNDPAGANERTEDDGVGTIIGNGGGDVALIFSTYGLRSVNYILELVNEQQQNYDRYCWYIPDNEEAIRRCREREPLLDRGMRERLEFYLATTQVFAVDNRLCPINNQNCSEEESLVAVNNRETKEIFVNITKWNELAEVNKIKISLHEFLSISGVENENYHISARYSPQILREVFLVDFTIDDFEKEILRKYNIQIDYVNFSDQTKLRTLIAMIRDCFSLVKLRQKDRSWIISSIELTEEKDLGWWYENRGVKNYTWIMDESMGFVNSPNIQQCYNKMVSEGLENLNE